QKKNAKADLLFVLLSIFVQIPLAVFLGHYYDERVFMTTGYLANSGLDPYQQHEITGVFSHPLLQGTIPGFGYPPPWTLMLGLTFRLSYLVVPDLFAYNFAIKIPIIAANICLAFLVRRFIIESDGTEKKARFAFLFLLFNPFTLLTTSAWGQIDSVAVLLCVASLYLLGKGRNRWSAITLALAFSVKPIVLPLLGLPIFFQTPKNWRRSLEYLAILGSIIFIIVILPFLFSGWQIPLAPGEWNSHFVTAGGLSLFGISELVNETQVLPQSLEILGFLWVPALLIGYYGVHRKPLASNIELVSKGIILSLIFFLTRSWLSEPNINLVLALILISVETNAITFRNFHFAWVLPFIFMFFNYSIPQLFFIPYPTVISDLVVLDAQIQTTRLIGRSIVVLLWQIFAWMFLFRAFKPKSSINHNERQTGPSYSEGKSRNRFGKYLFGGE
ncbi:MAG TPA: glycosyltransferase 87 family protein, partial [Candidatus Bathyarchaeia archaeon]